MNKYINKIKIDKDYVVQQIKKGITIKEIALNIAVSAECLRQFIIKNNIEYKKKIKYNSDDLFFDKDNEKSFYWAGFIAADGNISEKSDFSLTLKISDVSHIEKFKKDVSSDAPITFLPLDILPKLKHWGFPYGV
jgi:hypothetical protein